MCYGYIYIYFIQVCALLFPSMLSILSIFHKIKNIVIISFSIPFHQSRPNKPPTYSPCLCLLIKEQLWKLCLIERSRIPTSLLLAVHLRQLSLHGQRIKQFVQLILDHLVLQQKSQNQFNSSSFSPFQSYTPLARSSATNPRNSPL